MVSPKILIVSQEEVGYLVTLATFEFKSAVVDVGRTIEIHDPKMGPWHRGVISWINVLHLLPGDVSDFKEILGTQFFHNFLHEICGEADNLDFSTPQNCTIVQFLKREYPKFEVDGKALEYDEKELVLVLSVLLFHSVVKGSDVTRVKMCSVFDEETQVVVKIFVEKLIPLSDVLTKGDVVWAIQEAENGGSNSESPTCFSTTPKSRKTLQIFLQSPITQQQKVINEKCQEIQRLKLKLDSEKSEKNYLLEELAQADDKLKHISDKYKETLKEVKRLKSGMLQEAEEQQDMVLQGPDIAKEQKYSSVIGKLKNKIEELEESTYTLNQHNEELRKQVKGQSEKIVNLKSKLEDYFRECDRLGEELAVKKEQLDMVTERCQDLEKFLEETKASDVDPRHNLSVQSFTGEVEDLGKSVTDLKLCEEKEKNRALTEKVDELMLSLGDLESLKAQNSALQEQLSSTMELNETFTNNMQTSCHKIQLLEYRIAELETQNTSLQQLKFEIKGVQETANILHQANANLQAETELLTEQILKQQECMEKLRNEKNDQEEVHYKKMTQMTSRMEDMKLALEEQLQDSQRQIETLQIEKKEEAEIMKEVSSRNEALQLQKENLEETLLQEQFHMNQKNDKLKELSSTIEELMDKKVKLEGGLLEKQHHVEILLKEKQEEADKVKFALHNLWQALLKGAVTFIEEEFLLQEPAGPEDAVLLATQIMEKFEAEKLKLSSRNEALQIERMSLEESLQEEQNRMNENNNKLKELCSTIKELDDQKIKLEEGLYQEQCRVEILMKEKLEEADRVKYALGDLWQRVIQLVEGESSSQEPAAPEDAVQFVTNMVEKFEAEKLKVSSRNETLQVQKACLEETLLEEQKRLNEKNEKLEELSSTIHELEDQKVKLEERLFQEQGQVEILMKEKQEVVDKVKFALTDLWQHVVQLVEGDVETQVPVDPKDAIHLVTKLLDQFEAEKLKVSSRNEALQVQKTCLEETLLEEQKRLNEKNEKLEVLSSTIHEMEDQKVKLEERLFQEQGQVEILMKEKQEVADKVKFALSDLWQHVVQLVEGDVETQVPVDPEDAIHVVTKLLEQFEAEKLKVSSRNETLQVQKACLEETLLEEQKRLNEKKEKLEELSSTVHELEDQKVKLEERLFQEQGQVEILMKEKQEVADKVKFALTDLWQHVVQLVEGDVETQVPVDPEDAIHLVTKLLEQFEAEKLKVSSRNEALQVQKACLEETLLEEQKRLNEKNVKLEALSSAVHEMEDQKVKLEERLFQEQGQVEILMKEKQEENDKVKFALTDLWQHVVQLVEGDVETQVPVDPEDAIHLVTKLLEQFEAEKLKVSSRNETLQVQKACLEETLLEEQKRLNEKNEKLEELSSTIHELEDQKVKLEERLFQEQGQVEILMKEKQEVADKVKFALTDLWQHVVQLVEGDVETQVPVDPEDAIHLVTKLLEQFEAEKLKVSSRNEALQVQKACLEETLLEEQKRLNEKNVKLEALSSTIHELEDQKVKLEERLFQEQGQVEILMKEKQEVADKVKFALTDLWQHVVQLVEGDVETQVPVDPEDAIHLVTKLLEQFEAEKLKVSSRNEALQVQKACLEETLLEEQKRLNEKNVKLEALSSTIHELEDQKVKLEERLFQEQGQVEILMKEKQEVADKVKFALTDLWQHVVQLVEGDVETQVPVDPEDAIHLVTKLLEQFEAEKLKVSSRNEALQVQKACLEETLLEEQKRLNEKNVKLEALSSAVHEMEDQKVKLEERLFQEQGHVEILMREKQEVADKVKFALSDLWQHVVQLVEGDVETQVPVDPEDAIHLVTKLLEQFEAEKLKVSSRNEALQVQKACLEETLLEEQKRLNEKNEKLEELSSTIHELEDQKVKLEERLFQEQGQVEILMKEKQEENDKVKFALSDLWQRAVPLVEGEASSQEAAPHEDAIQFVTMLVEKFEAEKLKLSSRNEALQIERMSLEQSLLEEQNRMNENNNKLKELSSTIKELEDQKIILEEGLYQEQCRVEILKGKLEEADRVKFALSDLWQRVVPLVEGQVEPQVGAPDDAILLVTKLLEKFDAEKLKASSRNKTLQMQIASLEEALLEEQKRLNEKNNILKNLSSTVEELKDQKLKLEEGLFQEQRRVEIVVKEKKDETDRVKFALRDLWQGIGPVVEGNVSPQDPLCPEDPVQLVTKLVGYLQNSIITRTAECYSLEEKCKNFCELLDAKTETDKILGEVLAALESSFSKRLVALGNRRGTSEGAWCMLSLEALGCCLAAVDGCGGKVAGDLREVLRKVRVMEERPDAHEWATTEAEKLRERFKSEYSNVRKQLEVREAQLSEARATLKSMREKMEAELLRRVEVVKEEYKGKLDSLKATMKEAYNAEVAKLKVSGESEAQLKAFAEELKAKYRQLAMEKQEVQEELLRVKGRAECHDFVSDVAAATGSGDVLDETFTYVSRRRRSVRTSGMGRMFHEEDEQGEEFNNTYLADMKAGVCLPDDRLGELRYRNSLCPPHLKSSYPAETQFHDPSHVKDEDIMMGFPDDQARRKDRGYRKPGPPTPGKKGRSVVGDETATPRRALKEANDVSGRATPSRVKALFGLGRSSRRDENVPTPRTKALGLFRKPHKRF